MNFIIYDLEATCWRGRPPGGVNEIIEIGAVKLDRYGEKISSFNRFVKPKINPLLSHFCKELTSIKQEEIDHASHFKSVIKDFQDWVDIHNEYILCAWGDADIRLLRNDCKLHNVEDDWLEYNLNIKAQYHSLNKSLRKTGLKNTLKREGFEFTGTHHRAISDAENTAKIFIKHIDMWMF